MVVGSDPLDLSKNDYEAPTSLGVQSRSPAPGNISANERLRRGGASERERQGTREERLTDTNTTHQLMSVKGFTATTVQVKDTRYLQFLLKIYFGFGDNGNF